ncbi:MAG: hypothetical protein E7Y34_02820, partial [Mycoplasma sp.]|nr:hypothetical protein [Mycoplasma sp.]
MASLIIFIGFTIFILINIFVPNGWFSKKDTFMKTFILTFTTMFLFMGLAYGIALKKFKTKKDVFKVFLEIAREQSGFILVLIGALTFINLFSQTGMAALISNFFTNATQKMHLDKQPLLLLIIFIFVVSILNLFMAGRITKVLMIGPMFIPTFLKLNVHPVIVGAALRIGDSPTNIIT